MNVLDELVAQLKVWRHNPVEPAKKFIILFYGRSGSGLLRTLINCHPDIFCDEEIYLYRKAVLPERYLINRSKIYGREYYGHKAKLRQLEKQYGDLDLIRSIYFSGVKIIYLKRENFLRQALSGNIGRQRKIWHDTKPNPLNGKKYRTDPSWLIQRMRKIERYAIREKEILRGLTFLTLTYEDDLLLKKNHQKTADKVFDFLGVHSVPVRTPYVKTVPEKLEEVVENYHEVIEAVKNSEYAHFLDDVERLG